LEIVLKMLNGQCRKMHQAAFVAIGGPDPSAASTTDCANPPSPGLLDCQPALPETPETVAYYLTARAATHRRPRCSAAVSEILKGIRRTLGTAQQGKEPLFTTDLRKMIATLPQNLQGARDRALLVLGFAGGFRRSELVALDLADVQETEDGLVIYLRRSKTDQEWQGSRVALPWGSQPEWKASR
jgi:hypothetical protein